MADVATGDWAGRLLQAAGVAALCFTAAVLIPLGSAGLLVVALLGVLVVPAISAALCAVVTGGGLVRKPGRSRVPAAVSAASLAASAAFFCAWWVGLEPTDEFPLNSRALLITQTLALAVIATASAVALVLIVRRRTRTVPRWATGAAWVTVGLVALLTGQLAGLSVPRLEVMPSAAERREQEQTCAEAQGLPTAALAPGVPVPPAFPGAEPTGALVLSPARTGDPVGAGLSRFASIGESVVVSVAITREGDVDDLLAQIDQGLQASGLRNTGASTGSLNGDEQLYSVSFAGPGRQGSVQVVPCGAGSALITAEAVPRGRTGVCAPPALHARCDALLGATQSVSRRFEGSQVRRSGSSLQLVVDTVDSSPFAFLTGDVAEAFGDDGWRLVRSSCGEFCFGASSPVSFVFARDGYRATARLEERPADRQVKVQLLVTESR